MSVIKKHQSHLRAAPTRERPVIDDDQEFAVERDGDEIVLSLGMAPEFRVPAQTAIKLALLILNKAGVKVDHG